MMPPDDSPRPSRARSLALSAIKAVVSIGLLAVLFSRVDFARLWSVARQASPAWLAAALALYFLMVLASVLRWGILLRAQHVRLPYSFLTQSFLVATFFNNFLPSNIGGDVIRIADTAPAARSKTLATTVVASVFDPAALAVSVMRTTSPPMLLGRKLVKKVATRKDWVRKL